MDTLEKIGRSCLKLYRFIEGKAGILGLVLSIISISVAVSISRKSDAILNKVKDNISVTMDNTSVTIDLYKYQAFELLNSNIPFEEFTTEQKAIMLNYDKYNKDPQTAEEWLLKGFSLYYSKEDNIAAIKHYRMAIEIKPDFAEAYLNMGIAYRKTGDYKKAIECYEKLIELNTNLFSAYYYMGVAYLMLDNQNKANECFDKANKIRNKAK